MNLAIANDPQWDTRYESTDTVLERSKFFHRMYVRPYYTMQSIPEEVLNGLSRRKVSDSINTLVRELVPFDPDVFTVDYSKEEENVFVYYQKADIKFFFNLYFDNGVIDSIINLTYKGKLSTYEDSLEANLKKIIDYLV